ncbi:hypothetical protein ACFQ1Q_00965 [Winogradskyella litorisediminis]|uniref:Entericidin EcnA/B family protein n=1 Tax=Winogradskyella litorisediminis TaxID=1156618 RepID=A0ABW3N2E3_9FLAO
MKKLAFVFIALFSLSIMTTSCREKTTGEKVEDAAESVADDVEDAVD